MSAGEIHPQIRVFVRPYGSPVPLGFFAFGVGMFLYAGLDVGWVKPDEQATIGLLLAAFVTPLQLIATVFSFLCRDGGSATALGVFATSWLAGGLVLLTGKPGVLSPALGSYLVAFTCVIVMLGIASLGGKPLLSAFLLISSFRGILGAVYEFGGGHGWNVASGAVALAAFTVALYGGLAFLLEDTFGHTVLPLARRAGPREAIEESLPAQLRGVADEAGVRHTL